MDSYYLPDETEKHLQSHANECKNLGLLLDKYIPISAFEKPDKNDKNKGKAPWLARILEPTNADKGKKQNKHIDVELAQRAYQRWLAMTKTVGSQRFKATLDWRMVIGLGGETVLETDLTLHHLYGIPYIPASALKGLTRAFAVAEEKQFYIPEDAPESERVPSIEIDNDHPDIKRIFGTQKKAGSVIFFDAMPVDIGSKTTFELDIMNPHYPDYYRSKQNPLPPTNDQSPNPVTFLTVVNTTFEFALAPRDPQKTQHKSDVQLVSEILQKALQKYGVGGKTSAGYGYLRIVGEGEEAVKVAASSQATLTPTSASSAAQQPATVQRIRPNVPRFKEGQEITGSVVALTDELRRRAPADTKAYLRYQSFATKDVLMVVSAEEAQNWKPGDTRICLFVREEEQDGCTVLVCQPRPSKKKKG